MKTLSITESLARKIGFWTRLAILLAGLVQCADLVRAGDDRPFKGTFHGFAEPLDEPDGFGVVEIVITLKGKATHLGKYEMVLVHYLNVFTLAFTGYTEWTAANGDKLYTTLTGQGYPPADASPWLTFDVTHTIVGGTGRFEGATGQFEGVDGRFNLATGEDIGGYVGTISY